MLSCTTFSCFAQQDINTSSGKNNKQQEAGIFAQTGWNSDNENLSFFGLQYKRWQNEHFGWRAIGAFGNYSATKNVFSITSSSSEDTSVKRYVDTDIPLGMVGLGMEAQRTFYKRIVLFAAIELRASYGKGTQKNIETQESSKSNYNYYHVFTAADARLFYMALAPSIGAKCQFRKFNFGLEFSGINMNYTSLKIANFAAQGIFNFDAGNVNSRAFFAYNF